jgi:hypothetical protein
VIIHFCHLLPVTGSSIAYGRNVYLIPIQQAACQLKKRDTIKRKKIRWAKISEKEN